MASVMTFESILRSEGIAIWLDEHDRLTCRPRPTDPDIAWWIATYKPAIVTELRQAKTVAEGDLLARALAGAA
jgi:hypothetical protein